MPKPRDKAPHSHPKPGTPGATRLPEVGAALRLVCLLAVSCPGCSEDAVDGIPPEGADASVQGDAHVGPDARDSSQTPDGLDAAELAPASPGDLYVFECAPGLVVHTLADASGFEAFSSHVPAVIDASCSDGRWTFRAADWNRDGVVDVIAIQGAETGTHSTEVHVLDGATGFSSFAHQSGTPLEEAGRDGLFAFDVADYNGDGTADLIAVKKSNVVATEVHVLNGAAGFQSFLLQTQTPLPPVGKGDAWSFVAGDYDDDGKPDLIAMDRRVAGGDGFTHIHVLDGAQGFGQVLLEAKSALEAVGDGPGWAFSAGDYDGDGRADVFAFERQPAGASRSSMHVLGGGADYGVFLSRGETGLEAEGDGGFRQLDFAPARSWLSAGPRDDRTWDEIAHPLVFVGQGDGWEVPAQNSGEWRWVQQNADGLYINFIITDLQMKTAAKITQACSDAAALMKRKQLFYEADQRDGTMANDQRNLDAFQAAGLTTTHASYNYTIDFGWNEERAAVLRNHALMPGQSPRPTLVLLGPWMLGGDIEADTPYNAEVRHQLLDLADGFATDGPLGYYYGNVGGYRQALDSLMAFGRAHQKYQAVMLAPYSADVAGYSSAQHFLSMGIENVLQLESNGGSPGAWTIWEYADPLPAIPEANADGSAANTTMGMAYWLIHHLQGDGVGLDLVSRSSTPTSLGASFDMVNSSPWLVTSPLLQADFDDPSGAWQLHVTVDGQDMTEAVLAKTPGAYFAGGNSLAPGSRRSVAVSATCPGCPEPVTRPEFTLTLFGHLDARRVAQQWLVR